VLPLKFVVSKIVRRAGAKFFAAEFKRKAVLPKRCLAVAFVRKKSLVRSKMPHLIQGQFDWAISNDVGSS
jgi:hypothetical protein